MTNVAAPIAIEIHDQDHFISVYCLRNAHNTPATTSRRSGYNQSKPADSAPVSIAVAVSAANGPR